MLKQASYALSKIIIAVTLFFITTGISAKNSDITITGLSAVISDVKLHNANGGGFTSVGPVKATATVSGNTAVITLFGLTPGTYSKLHLKIDQLTLSGLYNGTGYAYTSDAGLNHNIHLDQPVTIGSSGEVTIWVNVDSGSIFSYKGKELNPNDAGNRNIIDRNIRAAFKDAFRSN